jgi:hypothetical protein
MNKREQERTRKKNLGFLLSMIFFRISALKLKQVRYLDDTRRCFTRQRLFWRRRLHLNSKDISTQAIIRAPRVGRWSWRTESTWRSRLIFLIFILYFAYYSITSDENCNTQTNSLTKKKIRLMEIGKELEKEKNKCNILRL